MPGSRDIGFFGLLSCTFLATITVLALYFDPDNTPVFEGKNTTPCTVAQPKFKIGFWFILPFFCLAASGGVVIWGSPCN